MSDLITQLKQDPFQFGLFQAASLLERIAQGQGDTAHWGPSDHPVRFKSDITLGFPAGDIQSIRPDDSGSYQVYLFDVLGWVARTIAIGVHGNALGQSPQ